MRLFRLMAEAQEELLRSPYPDLLMEMAVIRMAALAPVMDADELIRAIGKGGSGSGGASSSGDSSASGAGNIGSTRRMKVEGEVNAHAPVRPPGPLPISSPSGRSSLPSAIGQASMKPDLPELRDFIRTRRAALAGFMEQGAALTLTDDVLTVNARNDIYIRYLSDNRATIAELSGEFFGRAIRVEVASGGTVVSTATSKAPTGAVAAPNGIAKPPKPADIEKEPKLTVVVDAPKTEPAPTTPMPIVEPAAPKSRAGSPEDRQAVLQDPDMRRIFDDLEARLVEVRITADGETEPDASRKS
jgi:hypothetical protein